MTKGKSLRSCHLLITGRASILILLIIIITSTIISILVLKSLWRRRGRSDEATKASLSSCNTTDTGVHLTQLITKNVTASIHALKLCHDHLKRHTTTRRKRNGGRRNRGGWRIRCLGLWLLRSKLGLTLLNRRHANGTHDGKEMRIGDKDRKMVKDSRDSQRENEFITGHHISIDIGERKNEVRRKVYREVL